MRFYFAKILWVSLCLCAGVRAEISGDPSTWPDFSQYEGKFRMGLELEAGAAAMARVLDHFNYREILQKIPKGFLGLEDSELRAYIQNRGNFEALPVELKQRLVKEARANGKSVVWAWNQIPYHERNQQVDAARLPKSVIARHIGAVSAALKLKADAPERWVELMKRITIEPDAPGTRAITEFTHRESLPVLSPKEYLMDLRNLSDLLGVKEGLDQPKSGKGFSYHVHISDAQKPISDEVLHLFNLRLMLQALKRGRTGVLSGKGVVAYQSNLEKKGIIRRIADNRLELRLHLRDPVNELNDILEILSLGEVEARQKLSSEIRQLLGGKEQRSVYFNTLSKHKPEALVRILQRVVPELPRGRESLVEEILPRLKLHPEPNRVTEAVAVVLGEKPPKEVKALLVEVLSHLSPQHPALRTSLISKAWNWCSFGILGN